MLIDLSGSQTFIRLRLASPDVTPAPYKTDGYFYRNAREIQTYALSCISPSYSGYI